jgi:hypothetical protein
MISQVHYAEGIKSSATWKFLFSLQVRYRSRSLICYWRWSGAILMCRRPELFQCAITDEFSITHPNLLLMLTDQGIWWAEECKNIRIWQDQCCSAAKSTTLMLPVVQKMHKGWKTAIWAFIISHLCTSLNIYYAGLLSHPYKTGQN